MAHAINIGQAAKSTGMAAKTIRFYEEVGVLPAPTRTAAGYRQYTDEGVQQLLFVGRARALGLSLRQLKELTVTLDGGRRGPGRSRVREVVRAHLSAVQGRITELRSLQRQLEQVLRRIETPLRTRAPGRCRCLDPDDAPGGSVRRGARPR
jgi:DNA-binding transcriptional MerR regulator